MSNVGKSHAGDFNPSRLRVARERRSITKEALGQACGVTRRAVTGWEAGRVENPPVELIVEALAFPTSFFLGRMSMKFLSMPSAFGR